MAVATGLHGERVHRHVDDGRPLRLQPPHMGYLSDHVSDSTQAELGVYRAVCAGNVSGQAVLAAILLAVNRAGKLTRPDLVVDCSLNHCGLVQYRICDRVRDGMHVCV